jgi:hypothetical protein
VRTPLLLLLAVVTTAGEPDYQMLDQRAMLGVHMSPPSPALQFENRTTPDVGVEVLRIYRDTTAERMGLQVGDLIVTVNGGDIAMMGDLRNEVALTGVGGEVTVEVLRDGEPLTLTDTLGAWPEHIPQEPLDVKAEQRFRAWQEQRWQRISDATMGLERRIAALEQQAWARPDRDPVGPRQSAALQALPAFRMRVHVAYDTADRRCDHSERRVAWDARVLLGTPAPPIH